MEKTVPTDILQETFLNTVGAWVNMLILSSNGPIKTPVGACATALESLDTAHDLIMTGKAKLCLVGGVDDMGGMFVRRVECQRLIAVIC
jgi:fatty acid synthase subunit alpha